MNSIIQNKKYSISTPNGFESFSSIRKISNRKTLNVSLTNNFNISCTYDHKVFSESFGYVEISSLKVGDSIKTRAGYEQIVSIIENEKLADVYDIIDSGKDSCYWTGDILSHNCNFLGSTNTLINSNKIRELTFVSTTRDKWGLDIIETPMAGRTYVMTVDTSHGVGNDYSAFSIIDATSIPYKMVAKFRDNMISPLMYPEIIYRYGKWYNDAFVLVESNDIGSQVATSLQSDLEYENVLTSVNRSSAGAGQYISSGFAGSSQLGIRMTKQVKRIGCSNIKDLIEDNKIIIQDFDAIQEISTFIQKKQTYEAEDGHNDDLMMTLVMFGWLVRQSFFRELTNTDIRAKMASERYSDMLNDLLPAGFIDDGQSSEPENMETYVSGFARTDF